MQGVHSSYTAVYDDGDGKRVSFTPTAPTSNARLRERASSCLLSSLHPAARMLVLVHFRRNRPIFGLDRRWFSNAPLPALSISSKHQPVVSRLKGIHKGHLWVDPTARSSLRWCRPPDPCLAHPAPRIGRSRAIGKGNV